MQRGVPELQLTVQQRLVLVRSGLPSCVWQPDQGRKAILCSDLQFEFREVRVLNYSSLGFAMRSRAISRQATPRIA